MALDLNDYSPNTNTLTNVNTVSDVTSGLPYASSIHAAGFDRAGSQYFTAVAHSSLQPTGDFTLECWFKTTGSGIWHYLMQNANYDNPKWGGWVVGIKNTNHIYFQVGRYTNLTAGDGYQEANGTTDISDGNWRHMSAIRNGTTISLYLGTVLEAQASWTNPQAYGTPYFRLGGQTNNSTGVTTDFYSGTMDDFRLWVGTAKTVAEIGSSMSVNLTGSEGSISGYWPLEDVTPTGGFVSYRNLLGVGK